jgi:hypothetical protein
MRQMPFIQIRAAKFTILPGEAEELVNEGTYGKSFALYLQTQLASRGYDAPRVVCEDWGWWVSIGGLPFGCGLCVYGQAMGAGEQLDLCVSVGTAAERQWSWRKFRFLDTTHEVNRLNETLRDILRGDSEITIVSETDEFPLG